MRRRSGDSPLKACLAPAAPARAHALVNIEPDQAEMAPSLVSVPAGSGRDQSGTQSIERAILLLRQLAVRGQFGWRLSDLAARCGCDKGTAHRVLACLVRERLVQQRASDRHYLPGPLLFELSLSLPAHLAFQHTCEDRLTRFARRMDALAFLLLRSGNEYVCAVKAGTRTLRMVSVDAGTRRPLFTSVGGVAILDALSEDEARGVLINNIQQEVARCGNDRLAALKAMRQRSRKHGFGVNLGDVVPGLHAFAVAIRNPHGRPFASICLMGSADQFGEQRIDELHQALEKEASDIADDAAELLPDSL